MAIRVASIIIAGAVMLSACATEVADPPIRRGPAETTHYDFPPDGPVTPKIPNRLDLTPFVPRPCGLLERSDLKPFTMGPGDRGEEQREHPDQGDCFYNSRATDHDLLLRLYSNLNVLSGKYQGAKQDILFKPMNILGMPAAVLAEDNTACTVVVGVAENQGIVLYYVIRTRDNPRALAQACIKTVVGMVAVLKRVSA